MMQARARLEAIRGRIELYPPLPEEPETPPEPYKVRGVIYRERDELNQLKAKMIWLQNKMNKFLDDRKGNDGF